MDQALPVLLLTRPDPASCRFAEQVRQRFGDVPVVISPATRIVFRDAALPEGGFDGVIFTSENAVRGYCRLAPAAGLPAWCVGPRTAEAAADAGFRVTHGPGDAEGLLERIAAQAPRGRLLWPRGQDVALDIAERLNSDGIETVSVVLYAQEPQAPSAETRALLAAGAPVILPLFSPRGAREIAGWGADRDAPLQVVAISPGVAEAARGLSPLPVAVAATPDAAGMLDALAGFYAASPSP